jgi:hypothetical protein
LFAANGFLTGFLRVFRHTTADSLKTILNGGFLRRTQPSLSTHVFASRSQSAKNPTVIRARQELVTRAVLLQFLPINLVVLFASSANKQLIRDVFRMRLPTILISATTHPTRVVDYTLPGNSFEFAVLYFYSRFLLELLD